MPTPNSRRIFLALATLSGCAAPPPSFEDVPASGPARLVVVVESRVADEATVKTTCYWKAREAGTRLMEGAPGCAFTEHGRRVILWVAPRSFRDRLALEVAGHELLHQHNLIDHR